MQAQQYGSTLPENDDWGCTDLDAVIEAELASKASRKGSMTGKSSRRSSNEGVSRRASNESTASAGIKKRGSTTIGQQSR